MSRKVVIVDPDGNELNLEDALKYGYIDQKNYEELKNQENEYDDKLSMIMKMQGSKYST